jgi:mono/diheme cytochrome c family protein
MPPTAIRQLPSATPVPTATAGPPTATPGPSAQQLADLAAGKVLVQAQCAACHALADAGIAPAPSPVARPLDGIGGRHDRQWLEDELRSACAHVQPPGNGVPCSQMHSFSAMLSPEQRDQVVAYLLSLR